jgi:N-acetylmuramoyl-L-alanine amidase
MKKHIKLFEAWLNEATAKDAKKVKDILSMPYEKFVDTLKGNAKDPKVEAVLNMGKNDGVKTDEEVEVKEDEKVPAKKEEIIEKEIPKKEQIIKKVEKTIEKGIVFKIQISTSTKELVTIPSNFKGLSPISVEPSGSLFKYFYASEKNYDIIKQKLEEAKQKGYTTAFIVAYKDGIKINVTDAIK